MKPINPIHALVALFALNLPAPVFAQVESWEVFSSIHTVRELVRVENDLWGATNCGLFRFDLGTETFQTFTNAQGLSSNDIRAMTLDGRGNLVLGMGNAYVDIFNLSTHQVTQISDFTLNNKIFQIYALYNDQGIIYAGTDIGVSRLAYYPDLGTYLIEGTYSKLGEFPAEIAVKSIRVFAGGLWAGTNEGLARGDLSVTYLESPEGWSDYTTSQGLSGNDIAALEVFRDTLYAACTSSGLNRLVDSTFSPLEVNYTTNISFLKAHQDTLYLGRPGGVYRLEGDQVVRFGSSQSTGLTVEFAENGTLWAGMQVEASQFGGLLKLTDNSWTFYHPEGPRVEFVSDILVEENGNIWVTGRQDVSFNNGVLSHFDGQHWINLTRQNEYDLNGPPVSPDSFFWYEGRALAKDLGGSIWLASDGRGLGWFRLEGDTLLANAYYGPLTGRLFGIPAGPNFCVVRDLLVDAAGNIWVCNSEADPADGEAIAVVPADFMADSAAFPNWTYLTVSSEAGNPLPFAQFYVDRIAQDSFGRKWFGANNNTGIGINILDNKGTLSETDDEWFSVQNLPSDSITAMACDRDGIVWVGTPAGVQYFYPQVDMHDLVGVDLYVPVGQGIRAICIDPQNNKWFGTSSGISVLGADNFTWLHNYTIAVGPYPSSLPGDVVMAIAFDAQKGYAYLGTDKGLARLTTPYKGMGETISSVSIWPNPFIIGEGLNDRLYFDPQGLAEGAELKIFTAAGLLVEHLNTQEINSGWDGRNLHDELVGTGIYFLLAYSQDGQTQVGKVAVVHK